MAMQGREALLKRLARIKGAPRRTGRKALEDAAAAMVATMKSLAPVRSGKLRDSIKYRMGAGGDADLSVLITAGGPETTVEVRKGSGKPFDYALAAEFGVAAHEAGGKFEGAEHPGAQSQPFFWPAYRAHRRAAKSRITRGLKKGIIEDWSK